MSLQQSESCTLDEMIADEFLEDNWAYICCRDKSLRFFSASEIPQAFAGSSADYCRQHLSGRWSGIKISVEAEVKQMEFKCAFCDETFKSRASALIHPSCYTKRTTWCKEAAKSHFKKATKIPCCLCDATLTTMDALERHLAIHLDGDRYRCIQCQKMFCRPNGVQRHCKARIGKTRYPCVTCNKSFQRESCLVGHWRDSNCKKKTLTARG